MTKTSTEFEYNFRKTNSNNNAIIFIHGFTGSASKTFAYIPELLLNNTEMDGWDIIGIGYSSTVLPDIGKGIWSSNPDISTLANYLNTLLSFKFNHYHRLAIVAHSMGGLVAQRAILDMRPDLLAKLTNVMFFGTPSQGLFKAKLFSFLFTQVANMSFDSDFIKELRAEWKNQFKNGYSFKLEVFAGTQDQFVPPKSSLECFAEENCYVLEGNHTSLISSANDKDTSSQCYNVILNSLLNRDILPFTASWEERNILLGHYNEIINKYWGHWQDLSNKNLTQLVFALENSSRQADAMQILNHYINIAPNSDIMGILAGRYKRLFLQDGRTENYNKSKDLYKNALTIAEKESNSAQIYYHAINLAFLHIVEGDNFQGKNYANLALKHCQSDSISMWELATIAESYIYLEDYNKALEYYKKAIASGANLRERDSMYTNASYGYKAMNGDYTKDSEFLVQLRAILF